MSKELKPCPWCGKLPHPLFPDKRESNEYRCGDLKCLRGEGGTWNNAYCWKRISELESELASRIQQSNSWAEAATKANEKISELEARLAAKCEYHVDYGSDIDKKFEDLESTARSLREAARKCYQLEMENDIPENERFMVRNTNLINLANTAKAARPVIFKEADNK